MGSARHRGRSPAVGSSYGLQDSRSPGGRPHHFAFSVEPEAIPGIAEHLKERGLLARGPVDFGEGGCAVFCFDPDGNEVEFHDYFRRRAREATGGSG